MNNVVSNLINHIEAQKYYIIDIIRKKVQNIKVVFLLD